jgi:hypothetical protein
LILYNALKEKGDLILYTNESIKTGEGKGEEKRGEGKNNLKTLTSLLLP